MAGKNNPTVKKEDKKKAVLLAFQTDKFDYRTIAGIVKYTKLEAQEVEKLLEELDDVVRKSLVKNRDGETLYALRSKSKPTKEWVEEAKAFLSGRLGP